MKKRHLRQVLWTATTMLLVVTGLILIPHSPAPTKQSSPREDQVGEQIRSSAVTAIAIARTNEATPALTLATPVTAISAPKPLPPEPQFAAFQEWMRRFEAASAAERALLETEGVELATQRRSAMFSLIQTDPQRALELAVPRAGREQLPFAVRGLLEEPVDGRGDYAVLAVYPLPGQEREVVPIQRSVTIGERQWRAFVYGARVEYPTKQDLSLHGVALDDVMAVSQDALVVRDRHDPDLRAPKLEEAVCSISGALATVVNEPTPVDIGGEITWLCRYDHAEELNEKLLAAAGQPGGSPEGDPAESPYTEGRKRVVMFRVAFPNLPTPDVTSNSLVGVHAAVNNFWRTNSYGRTSLAPLGQGSTIVQINVANPYASYNDNASALRNDVRAAATAQGIDLSTYDFDVVYTGGGRPSFSFGGLGFVGGPGAWVVGASTSITAHEMGHNLGFPHANYWDTGGASANGPGGNQEYGDPFDVMGGGSASGGATGHYVSKFKWRIGWLLDEDFPRVASSGTYRIYAHDHMDARGIRGVRFARDGALDYFLEFRQLFVSNPALMNGIGLRWGSPGGSSSQLIDTTPGSHPDSVANKNDAAITIGRTFSDPAAAVHITPIGFGNTYPQSIDVRINFGNPASNQPPTLFISSNPEGAAPGGGVILTAVATDPNGDALSYAWNFGDGNYSTNNLPVQTKSWAAVGEYVVRCVATDMKGGTTSKSLLVRVGDPTTFSISGRVITQGRPVADVLVRASSTRLGYSDSDGAYIITGLAAGSYSVAAQLYPLTFVTPFFSNPVVVGPSAREVILIGVTAPLNDVILSPTGSVWKYLATGANAGTAWVNPTFNDASWASGRAELGYGDGDEATVVGFGPDANNKYITTYFRRAFNIADPEGLSNFTLNLRRDDGAIVYLNGVEVLRDNLPSGVVTFATPAIDNSEDTTVATIDPELILQGTNVLAVEVHQVTGSSSDLSFEMSLTATTETNFSSLDAFFISKPTSDSVANDSAEVLIEVGAFSTDKTFAQVEFFSDATLLGEDLTAPFTWAWSGGEVGTHQLRAVATFSSGQRMTSAPVTISIVAPIQQTLLASNASWNYHDGGVDLGSAWRAPGFSDVTWSNGPAPLGFGDPGIATTLQAGPSVSRTPTFYFRQSFDVIDASLVTNLTVDVYRDDGVILYLNGEEAARINMPLVPVGFSTLAASGLDGISETLPFRATLPVSLLQNGPNVLAAELHQAGVTSSDARFDLELTARFSALPTPGVRLTAPTNGAAIGVPATRRLAATALPRPGQSIERVEFYVNGQVESEDTSVPYQFDWMALVPGPAVLQALAYETGGITYTSATVTVFGQAPRLGQQLISPRALWRYLDTGVDAGTSWRQRSFDDSGWAQGYARLGYGGDGELSTVSFGGNPAQRNITTYFRRAFVVTNLAAVQGLQLFLSRDDGAIVYINGVEVYRNNLREGVVVSHNSLALVPIEGANESTFLETRLASTGLFSGTNVIAVEIHQQAINSGDLGFDLALIAQADTNLTEGVYLTSPAEGAHITLPSSAALTAFATSADHGIAEVEFFADGQSLAHDLSLPYQFTWTAGTVGTHALHAVASLLDGGSITSASVTIFIDAPPMMVSPVMNTFISSGSSWRHLNSPTAPPGTWNTREFDDGSWTVGNARFGYGLDGEVTAITSGRVTHYFRRYFNVPNPAFIEDLIFQLQRDDGAVVYLNGIEMFRSNMPGGPVGNTTLALATANGLDEQEFFITTVSTPPLVSGTNLVAVELHQSAANSSDAGFDLHLNGVGSTAPRVLLSRPTSGQSFTPETPVEIEVAAWPGQGRTIARVEFFGDNAKIGEDTTEPFTFAWSNLPFGTHTVKARMTDDFGASLDSTSASFSVGFAVIGTNFISAGATWSFLDNGSNQGTNWAQPTFNDGAWASGPAQLGYGDGDEGTPVSYGPTESAKYITTYFRRTFHMPADWVMTNLTFRLLRDDGAVVWLNGREVYRSNMPGGAVAFSTLAAASVDNANESTFFLTSVVITNLPVGTNVVGVEIHQRAGNSSDISFDLELNGSGYSVATEPPRPRVLLLVNGQIEVSWKTAAGWNLVTSTSLTPGAAWTPVGISAVESGGTSRVTLVPNEQSAFYRLAK